MSERAAQGVSDEDIYLTPEELSARLKGKVAVGTLKQWRHKKIGPKASRMGRAILYRLDHVKKWEEERTGDKPQ